MTTPIEPPVAPDVAAGAPSEQGLSIASLVLGIAGLLLSIVGFGFLPALAAVITGHLAQKRQPASRPFWLTGLITGYVGVAIGVIMGIIVILLGGLFFLTISGVGS